MNRHRRKKQRRLSVGEVVILALAAVILMTGGVTHAWLKNSHVEVKRGIDQTEQRIGDHQDVINSLQVKIDKKLNIYQLRADLENSGSSLRQVPASAIEVIPAYTPATRQAGSDNRSPALVGTNTP